MDRGKKPLHQEIVGEWTTGYYVSYPMVNKPIGANVLNYPMVNQTMGNTFSLTPDTVSQFQWSQNPNSVSQTSYAEVIKGAENLLKQQQIEEEKELSKIKDFYNPGLLPEIYDFINEIWKTHVSQQRANFRRALSRFSLFLVEKTAKENEAEDLLIKSILYREWDEFQLEFMDIEEINNLLDVFQYFIHKGKNNYIMNKVFRICMYNKARKLLPVEIFTKINEVICRQQIQFQKAFSEYFLQAYVFTDYLDNEFPTLKYKLDHELFDITNIELSFTKEIIVQNLSFHLLKDFLTIVKSVLQNIINNDD
ncbi:hypothetical protein Gotur_006954, partial [Gossypium turneri]